MTAKFWVLLALAVGLGGLSLYLNRDWFATDNIQIYHRFRDARMPLFARKRLETAAIAPMVFGFNRKLKLNSLQVIPVNELKTNKYAHPIWHLVSDSNSVPVQSLIYGMRIAGMRPAVKDTTPDPLVPGVRYRLIVEAGKLKAEHDFIPEPNTP